MSRISFRKIFIAFLVLFLLSRSYWFVQLYEQIRIGEKFEETGQIINDMHPVVFYTDVFLVMALFFITIVKLLSNRK